MHAAVVQPDALRIVSLNIQHGGGTRIERLTNRLLRYGAEVLVITEFRLGKAATLLQDLGTAGYAVTYPVGVDPKQNTVLIASRQPILRDWAFDKALDARHLWCAEAAGIRLCAAYLPVPTELRVPHLEALIANARSSGIELIIGDFNTGRNDLDSSSARSRFPRSDLVDGLIGAGYTDLWRHTHPGQRDYSYFSRKSGNPYNGFRIDHAFAAAKLTQRVLACEFDHDPRREQETDHAALSLWISHTQVR